jgi:hypothetical protein
MTMEDAPNGAEFVDLVGQKGIVHIKPRPIDLSSFKFLEGSLREGGVGGYGEAALWKEYVTGLLEGKILEKQPDMLLSIPPEDIADIINTAVPEEIDEEAYERVVSQYVRRSGGELRLSPETTKKLFLLIDNLSEGLKEQFLSKTFEHVSKNEAEVDKVLSELTPDSFHSIVKFFNEFSSSMPSTLKKVIEKLSVTKVDKGFEFDNMTGNTAIVHDIEISDNMKSLFEEESFKNYVSDDYKDSLWTMLKKSVPQNKVMLEKLTHDCTDEIVDRVASQSMIEVLEFEDISRDDYLTVVTRLTDHAKLFLDTGRFADVLDIYIAVHSQAFGNRFRVEAESTMKYVFQTDEFLSRIIEAAKVSGRARREDFVKLARAFKFHLIGPLFDALSEEENTTTRKFLLTVLTDLRSDIVLEAIKRLKDERWYVVRNMLYLLSKCGRAEHAEHVRKFAKHPDTRVCAEAVGALLQFRTPDAVPHLKVQLKSDNIDLRNQALKLVSAYRVKAAVPLISELLVQRDFLGIDAYHKAPLITALGRIGDDRAIEPFTKVMKSNTLLYKTGLNELKLEILKNIRHFHPGKTKTIVEQAMKSRNEKIRSLGEKYFEASSGKKQEKG